MQNSSVSYRGKYASQSRRSCTNAVQQMHIQELQQKVDIILLHNTQLIDQNNRLKHLLQMNDYKVTENKYSSNSSDIYRLTRQLQLKNIQIQEITRQNILEKQSISIQLDNLNDVIKDLTTSRELILFQKEELEKTISKFNLEKKMQFQNLKQELQNQMYENSLKKQIQHKEEMRDKQSELNRILEKKLKQWQDQKTQMEQQKMNTIVNIEQKMEKEKQETRKTIQDHFNKTLNKIQNEADQKCRKVREHSESYIKSILQQQKQQEQRPQEELKKQIEGLRQSLEQRQKVIESLLKFQIKSGSSNPSYYNQVQDLRERIKQLTQSFFRQSEILKVKMASKHQLDIQETIKVYDNKIEILASRISYLQSDNSRLRENYEQQIRSKMKQRQRFQIQASKLKSYIRKMKIELESYGKQMRLNIDGIRDQANSFSMSILGQLGQQKNKKNFYEEEIRKMRQVIDLKQHEMDTLAKQNQQKFRYYEDKIKTAQQNIHSLRQQVQQKDEKFREQIDSLKQNAREQQRKQKEHWDQQSKQLKKQIIDLRKLTEKLEQTLKETEFEKKGTQKQLDRIKSQLEQRKAHIQQMKLEMQMMGQNQANQQRNALKIHYERIIEQMQHDKKILKETNSAQSEQLSKLVAKYKIMQKSLQKTLSTMKKKTELEKRVIELGLDNNLVKNLTEVFRKSQEQKQNI